MSGPSVRDVRSLIAKTGAALTGRKRRHDPVHRHSYDVDSKQADVFRPVGGGTVAGGLAWVDDYLRLAKEYDVINKQPGARSPLMANGIRVLEVLLRKFMNFKTGQLDPALTRLMKETALSKSAVVDALKRLKRHGFLDWVRRSEKTEAADDRMAGPQRRQVSNAYFCNVSALAKAVRARFLNLREARRRRQTAAAAAQGNPLIVAAPQKPADPLLEAVLDKVEQGIGARVQIS